MMKPTMEEYMTKTQEDYRSGVTRQKFDKDAIFELKALGRLLEDIHVTWAHLEKKHTRLQLYTEVVSRIAHRAWRRCRNFLVMSPRDKKLIGGRKTRKSEDCILRRALCRLAGGIATCQRAQLYYRMAQAFAAWQDHDDLEECMDDGDSKVAKEAKLFDAFDYGRKTVNDVDVEIHGVKFKVDFVVLDYVNEGEPSIVFGRDFLATTKSQVDFGLGEIRMNLTKFKEGIKVIDLSKEVGSSSEEQKDKMKEVLDIKYKELEESKPILEVIENYVIYKMKLDEILIGKERLNKKEFSDEDKVGIIEHGLPKKMCDPKNYVLPLKINGVVEMVALVDTEASVSVLPYSLYKDIGLDDPRPCQTNLTMADNTQAKTMGEVKNVRIQIGYQAYVVDLLILDILVDPELPLLLGRPFLRTCRAIIDMVREDDWLGSFEVGKDEDGNVKYGLVAPSFIDIKDDIERALGNEGYGTYKNIDGDGDWHARLENLVNLEKMVKKFEVEEEFLKVFRRPIRALGRKSRWETLPNPLIAEYERRNKRNTITYSLQHVSNANLKWKDLPSVERHAYCEKLSKLQEISFGVPRVANWHLFDGYGFEDTLREMMKMEYIYEGDGDEFDVDRTNLMKEKCIWFRLCGQEHILTVLEFTVILGLFTEDEVEHCLFEVYFGHYVTRIASFIGYCMDEEIKKCLELIDYEYWTSKMLADELDKKNTCWKKETGIPTQTGEGSSRQRQKHGGLNTSWGDWNASLNQGNFAYPTYEPPNVPPYPYPYIHYPYPYTHYPDSGNQNNQGGSYGLGGADYFMSAMPDFRGSSSGNAVGGSSREARFNDDVDMDE
ncbi:retrovirus-related pol polyprotein from transposon TNT 1-94 [Tanacetum coccineum]|uniref:Retrovirus-related pol polyprotein from transposon TNT 1-94 n=1 Tax=Tanacetum coccineum TaxID=301880 RepID=A0ABQ4YSF9_9ASTR